MSTYTVDMTEPSTINLAPATTAEEIAQNIRIILSTPLGSSPLARNIGIDYSIVDDPFPIAEARLTAEVYAAISEQEPRAVIADVSFKDTLTDAQTGRLLAVVRYSLAEEVQ